MVRGCMPLIPDDSLRGWSAFLDKSRPDLHNASMRGDFRHWRQVPVRWADQDTFGHVNNAVYFTFFETARIAYLEDLGFWSNPGRPPRGPVLARIACNFRHQLQYPATVHVGTRVVDLRNRSFTLEQAIFLDGSETLVADGDSVIVWFDYEEGRSIPLPAPLRESVARVEGELPAGGASRPT